VQAVAELVVEGLADARIKPIGVEGLREGQWALIDIGSVVVHVFHSFTRQVYDLEGLWHRAPRLPLEAARRRTPVDR
jgi:ribosome-associated protein